MLSTILAKKNFLRGVQNDPLGSFDVTRSNSPCVSQVNTRQFGRRNLAIRSDKSFSRHPFNYFFQ